MEIREATVVTRIFCGNDKCGRLKLRKFPLKFYSFFSSGNYQVFQTPSSRRLFYRDLQLFFHLCNSHWFIRATIFLTINYRRKFFSVILLFSRDSDPSFLSITSKRNRKGVMEDILKTSFSFLPFFLYLFIYSLFRWWENSSATKLGWNIWLFDRVIRLMRLSMID